MIVAYFYLAQRLLVSAEGANPALFWSLWLAEAFGVANFSLFVFNTWSKVPSRQFDPLHHGSVAVLIPTYNEPRHVLEPTLLRARQLRGATSVHVLDDGARDWVAQLCDSLGLSYVSRQDRSHAKAGNLNNALQRLNADYFLILDADHVPHKEIIPKLLGYFADPKIGIVQAMQGFRNIDSVQHMRGQLHEQSLFFDVLQPQREALEASFWCGSGALIRASALRESGGISHRTITEDLETSLKLQQLGYRTIYHKEELVRGLAPSTWEAFLVQRYRWARGTLEVLTSRLSPIIARGFRFKTRVSYIANLFYYLVPLQLIAYVGVLIAMMITGLLPMGEPPLWLILLWAIQVAMSLLVTKKISGESQTVFGSSQAAWLNAVIFIRAWLSALSRSKSSFKVTPKDGSNPGGFRVLSLIWLPGILLIALLASVAFRVVIQLMKASPVALMPLWALAIALIFAFGESVSLFSVVMKLYRKTQIREYWREPVSATARIDGVAGEVRNLHEFGVQVLLAADAEVNLAPDQECQLEIDFGPGDPLRGRVIVRSIHRTDSGALAIGGVASWASALDRRRVIELEHEGRGPVVFE